MASIEGNPQCAWKILCKMVPNDNVARFYSYGSILFLIMLTDPTLVLHFRRNLSRVGVLKLFMCVLATRRLQLSMAKAIHECALDVTETLLVTSCIIISFALSKYDSSLWLQCFSFILIGSFWRILNPWDLFGEELVS